MIKNNKQMNQISKKMKLNLKKNQSKFKIRNKHLSNLKEKFRLFLNNSPIMKFLLYLWKNKMKKEDQNNVYINKSNNHR